MNPNSTINSHASCGILMHSDNSVTRQMHEGNFVNVQILNEQMVVK